MENSSSALGRRKCELEALKAIYQDALDISPSDLVFHINIDRTTASKRAVSVDLRIQIPEAYLSGSSEPCLRIEIAKIKGAALSKSETESIQRVLNTKSSELVKENSGNEILFDLLQSLHDELHSRFLSPSRIEHEISCATEEESLVDADHEEEPRFDVELAKAIDDEYQEKLNMLSKIEGCQIPRQVDVIKFDEPFILDDGGSPILSVKLTKKVDSVSWPFSEAYECVGLLKGDVQYSSLLCRKVNLDLPLFKTPQGVKRIEKIIACISQVSKLPHHPGIIPLYAYQVDRSGPYPVLFVISAPFEDSISLGNLMERFGPFHPSKILSFIQSILLVIEQLHMNKVVHRNLNKQTVLYNIRTKSLKIVDPLISALIAEFLNTDNQSETPIHISLQPPEIFTTSSKQVQDRLDIWHVGVLILELFFGESLKRTGDIERLKNMLPHPLNLLVSKSMSANPANRPTATQMLQIINDSSMRGIMDHPMTQPIERVYERTERRDSQSRYKTDFDEIQFLGKGGFGSVVKVRNKIDGRFYAIKRIRLESHGVDEALAMEINQKILREVTALSRLHHDRIVRYYQAWIEENIDENQNQKSHDSNDTISLVSSTTVNFSGLNPFNEESDSSDDDGLFNTGAFHRLRNASLNESTLALAANNHIYFESGTDDLEQRKLNTVLTNSTECIRSEKKSQYLYIQMEYCPNQTLRDAIDDGLDDPKEVWRLFRQILEGLVHIHSQGMIHRDLKPSNIFIDSNGDIKIGDFGLAVSGSGTVLNVKGNAMESLSSIDESHTLGVGTPFYVSPELETIDASYNHKVDMYSLGIIFAEMWLHFSTSMERVRTLCDIRSPNINLPAAFYTPEMTKPLEIAMRLLNHDPKNRLSSIDLFKSNLLPALAEDETINESIRGIMSSDHHVKKAIAALFQREYGMHHDFTYDLQSGF